MKTVTLIRHAKSSREHIGLDDIDRPLNERGRADAQLMGALLAKRGMALDRLYASPALRALRTAQIVAQAIDYPEGHIALDSRWYLLDANSLLGVLRHQEAHLGWVACVGHNPELTELANLLAARAIENMPTCGILELQFDTPDWSTLGKLAPSRITFDIPKNHRPVV